jgi:hypothetical protein
VKREALPQLRAHRTTIWAAWLRDDIGLGNGGFHAPSLVAARLSGGAWSLPRRSGRDAGAQPKAIEVGFSLLAVSHDVAWLAWTVRRDGDRSRASATSSLAVRSAGAGRRRMPSRTTRSPRTRPLRRVDHGRADRDLRVRQCAEPGARVRWTGSAWSDSRTT